MNAPRLEHTTEVVAAFYDVDPLEVVWHGHYVKYLELARNALMARFDYDYPQMRESGYAWPIVDMRLKYVDMLPYGRRAIVRAEIVEWENRIKVDYVIRDAETGKVINKAHTIQVALNIATREMEWVCPPVLWQKLGVSPA